MKIRFYQDIPYRLATAEGGAAPAEGGDAGGSPPPQGDTPPPEDPNLMDALDVQGDEGDDADGDAGGDAGREDDAAAKAAAAAAAAKTADEKAAQAKAEADKAKAAKAKSAATKAKAKAQEEPKWFEADIQDATLRAYAEAFDSRDALVETLTAFQDALGLKPADDWRASIEDEKLREHANRFQSPADAVQKHFELRQKLSTALIPPGKKAPKAEQEAFATRLAKALGVPEKPEDYEFPEPPKGTELTEDQTASRENWAQFFHDIHLPKTQASAILKKFTEETEAGEAALREADKKNADVTTAQLKSEWGNDFDSNTALASRAGRELFGDDYDSVLGATLENGSLLMDTPFMLRMLARIGREMSEGSMDVLTAGEKETINDQIEDLRSRSAEAMNEGKTRLANELYQQEQALLNKISGRQPIVGDSGRSV